MTTAEQPPPEGDNQPPQAASVDSPDDGSDAPSSNRARRQRATPNLQTSEPLTRGTNTAIWWPGAVALQAE